MMRQNLLTLIACFFVFQSFAYSVDVTTLGAKGDGITDNTAIIQKAIDDCSARQGSLLNITIYVQNSLSF